MWLLVAGKNQNIVVPRVCLDSSFFGVTQAKKPFCQVLPYPGNSKRSAQGSRIQPAQCSAREPETRERQQAASQLCSLGSLARTTSAECSRSVNWKSFLKENFQPDGKLRNYGETSGPIQIPLKLVATLPFPFLVQSRGQSTLPKATQKICNIPSNDFQYLKLQKSSPFLWVHQSCLPEYLLANRLSHTQRVFPFRSPLQQRKNIIKGDSTGL